MAFCPSCGHQCRQEAKFCRNCGGSLADESLQVSPVASDWLRLDEVIYTREQEIRSHRGAPRVLRSVRPLGVSVGQFPRYECGLLWCKLAPSLAHRLRRYC